MIDSKIKGLQTQVAEIVKDLHALTIAIQHNELAQKVDDIRQRLSDPFLFVIVGEVKAGKSSFINALLQSNEEICKVAPNPCTDVIQQILFGNESNETQINPFLKQIFRPFSILQEISIVDTPGTNTIVEHHQEITERFVPGADLIVFVFEAKNPYRQSAWDFFKYIHKDWYKKIIFVLQQKDLLSVEDLEINARGVHEYAQKQGIDHPIVFSVSAKQELENKNSESGFLPLREYINHNITGGKAPMLKLQNNLNTAIRIQQNIQEGIDLRTHQWNADKTFRKDIIDTLNEQEARSKNQVDKLLQNLLDAYDKETMATAIELENGLNFFSLTKKAFLSLFSKKESPKEWFNDLSTGLENKLNLSLQEKLKYGVQDIADSIQQMTKIVHLKIQNSETILKNDHHIFGNIAEKRTFILHELQEQFSRFIEKNESFLGRDVIDKNNSPAPNIATGSGIAIIGVVLSLLTQTTVVDITGGVLTAVGLLFAGITVGLKKRKIMNEYDAQILKGRNELSAEIKSKLDNYIVHIKNKIDQNFVHFDNLINTEEKHLAELNNKIIAIHQRLILLTNQIQF